MRNIRASVVYVYVYGMYFSDEKARSPHMEK